MLFRIVIVFFLSLSTAFAALTLKNGIYPYPAPQIEGITEWINSEPLQLNQLKGKVVLIDFWTYSCINCVRTLPYLKAWYHKYHDAGFVIIGVHAPEFGFEKNASNVQTAVLKQNIKYPVALDNDFKTWRNFNNHYWPAHYLIDKNGRVVYQHFGEGEYDTTENNIRFLLGLTTPAVAQPDLDAQYPALTPETYLGYARAENFTSPETRSNNQAAQYTFPKELRDNDWALSGNWIINADRIVSAQPYAKLKIHCNAQKVFMVMGNASIKPIQLQILFNGENVTKSLEVDKHTLYEVLSLPQLDNGILEVIASSPGLEIYTFTFG